jgi:hypothetical protein
MKIRVHDFILLKMIEKISFVTIHKSLREDI